MVARPKASTPGKTVAAGGIAGALEICMTYPIEYTKTMQQLAHERTTVRQVVSTTLARHGALGMYKGLSSMLYFAAPKAAIRFSSKERFSNLLAPYHATLGRGTGFLAGLGAGTLEACVPVHVSPRPSPSQHLRHHAPGDPQDQADPRSVHQQDSQARRRPPLLEATHPAPLRAMSGSVAPYTASAPSWPRRASGAAIAVSAPRSPR